MKFMDLKNDALRVRFAPSPTGYMHIGNFRTALYNYLFAKKQGGSFIIRIEDTDQTRFIPGAAEQLLESMHEMGINWDEGNKIKSKTQMSNVKTADSATYPETVEVGEFGPYAQSERTEIYQKYAEQLIASGHAYYCFCEPERLNKMREQQQLEKRAPMYDGYCLAHYSAENIVEKLKQKCPVTIRLRVPKNETVIFDDVIRGKVSFNTDNIDDQVLMKSDGFPTYHLANVVDDHLMGISHVIRGEDWLPSTPKHVLLYKAFNWEAPTFAHLPLLLNPDRTKLSKRQGDVAVEDYIANGYLKEAILNFVAMLGWNPGEGNTQEIFSLNELIEKFELKKVHKAGAVFDIKKLDWINGQYIKKLTPEELLKNALPFLKKKEFFRQWTLKNQTLSAQEQDVFLGKVLAVEKDRLLKFSDVGDESIFFFQDISYDKEALRWKNNTNQELLDSLLLAKKVLIEIDEEKWTLAELETNLLHAAGDKRGDLLWPLRMALTGAQKSPSPFECAWVLGKEKSLSRIDDAIGMWR
jgi:glutamyl-tRNA synthetase